MTTQNKNEMTDAERANKWLEEEGGIQFPDLTIMHTIKTALQNADKVDGLVKVLEQISRMSTMPDKMCNTITLGAARMIAEQALNEFNKGK